MDIPVDLPVVFLQTFQVPIYVLRWPNLFGPSMVAVTRDSGNE